MAYTIQAFIGDEMAVRSIAPPNAKVILLAQSKALLPLTEEIRKCFGIPFLPLTDEGEDEVPPSIASMATSSAKIAYIEAEYFGGTGIQAAAIWEGGQRVFGPVVADGAINQALRQLGVLKGEHRDEFDALKLGHHRHIDEWA